MKPRIAIFGATGAVGTLVCKLLAERNFPFQSIRFFGSPNSGTHRKIEFDGTEFLVEPLLQENVHDIDIAIGSTPDHVARECAAWVVEQSGIFVDESAAHRMLDHVPLIIPEINPDAIRTHSGIIASPNCSTTQLAVCLKPIYDQMGIRRVVVSTYQSASGAGNSALQELLEGTRAVLNAKPAINQHFESPLPLNLWPKIGSLLEDGSTSEETKMVLETRKILNDDSLRINVTCVRVPVPNCHSETVVVETQKVATAEEFTELLAAAPGITVLDEPADLKLPTPQICDGDDSVFVGRIRRDLSVENGFAFWCVSDNLRKGAATNAVQIAELLLNG